MPEKLKTTHFDLTIAQLQHTRDSRYNEKCDAARLADSLSACISNKTPVDLETEPFLFHTSNFRVPVIDDFLNRIGISQASIRASRTKQLEDYIASQEEMSIASRVSPEKVRDLVNDLVERRNQVAHGDTSAVLAPSAIYPYCDIVEVYCKSLARVVRDSLVGELAISEGTLLDSHIDVYNHNIVCVHSRGVEFHPGALLACKTESGRWYSLLIEEVQIDGATVATSPKGQDIPVGLRTDGRCKKEHIVYSIF